MTREMTYPFTELGNIEYYARITKQRGREYLVEFPDLPGCLTEGDSIEDAISNAREALSGWLFVAIKHGDKVAPPTVYHGRNYMRITPDLDVAVPLLILWARKRCGFTQKQVASALGISQQAYRKFEIPGRSNPTIKTLARLSSVLGVHFTVQPAP